MLIKFGGQKSFTLAELITVILVIAVLSALAIPHYLKGIEKSKNKEAKAMLKLLASAEEVYRLENGFFVGCGDTSACNSLLDLRLKEKDWSYKASAPSSDYFSATAKRQGSDERTWTITSNEENNPVCGGEKERYCE